jgi:hypothetical protein
MIERFRLPDTAPTAQCLVHRVRGRAFDGLHDLAKRVRVPTIISKRSEQHVHVIWHDDSGMNEQLDPMVMETVTEHERADGLRKRPTLVRDERDKQRLTIVLNVRQLARVLGSRGFRTPDSRGRLSYITRAPPVDR